MAARRAGVRLGADTPTLHKMYDAHAARYAEALHADWKHGPRLTRSTSSKNPNEIKNKLRIKKKKARQKAAGEPPRRAALTFVVLLAVASRPKWDNPGLENYASCHLLEACGDSCFSAAKNCLRLRITHRHLAA